MLIKIKKNIASFDCYECHAYFQKLGVACERADCDCTIGPPKPLKYLRPEDKEKIEQGLYIIRGLQCTKCKVIRDFYIVNRDTMLVYEGAREVPFTKEWAAKFYADRSS
jgi:hypothetical protein